MVINNVHDGTELNYAADDGNYAEGVPEVAVDRHFE
jgi:hypothetical protein